VNKFFEGTEDMLRARQLELMACDKQVAQAEHEFQQCKAELDENLNNFYKEDDPELLKMKKMKLEVRQRQLEQLAKTHVDLRRDRNAGYDNLIDQRTKLTDAVANMLRAETDMRHEAYSEYKDASAEFDQRMREILSVVDMHVKITLGLWFMLLLGKYHKYAMHDWFTTSGMITFGAILAGYGTLGPTMFAQVFTQGSSLAGNHSCILLVGLMALHFTITFIAGYKRVYLDGLFAICSALAGYVFLFERHVMKHLSMRKLTDTTLHAVKYLLGFGIALVICGAAYLCFHAGVRKCMLPALRAQDKIAYVSSNCQPSVVIKAGERCDVACKKGHTNIGKTKACGWFSSCAVTTYECVEDVEGSHFKYGVNGVDLTCYAEEEDPYYSANSGD